MAAEHAEDKAPYDDVNIRSIVLIGGVGAILVFVAIVAVQVIYFRYEQAEYVRKIEQMPFASVNEQLAAQRERLAAAGPGAAEGDQAIPIEKAMALVVAEYQRKQAADPDDEEPPQDPRPERRTLPDETAAD